jgi:hypothetical protein
MGTARALGQRIPLLGNMHEALSLIEKIFRVKIQVMPGT